MSLRKALVVTISILALTLTLPSVARSASLTFAAIGMGAMDGNGDGVFESFVPGMQTGRVDPVPFEFRFALEFDISAIPDGATITSALIGLRTSRPDKAGQTTLAGYTGDGVIALGDMTAGLDVLTFIPPNAGLNFYDVTTFLESLHAADATWAGFAARQNPLLADSSAFWGSPDSTPYPALVVDYTVQSVPEPATLLLVSGGISGLLARRLRRRHRSEEGDLS